MVVSLHCTNYQEVGSGLPVTTKTPFRDRDDAHASWAAMRPGLLPATEVSLERDAGLLYLFAELGSHQIGGRLLIGRLSREQNHVDPRRCDFRLRIRPSLNQTIMTQRDLRERRFGRPL